jgi:flavin-dependent dehydrogenase
MRERELVKECDIAIIGAGPAGLISPSSGDGISFALTSGYNCALALNEDFSGAASRYRHLCNPLVKEIKDKIRKSEIISDPARRGEFLQNM